MANATAEARDDRSLDKVAADGDHLVLVVDGALNRLPQAPDVASSADRRCSRAAKRGLDISIALALLILMAPLLALIILLIQLESPGSPFYRARRVGYRGRALDVLKFRKMAHNAMGLPLTLVGDRRLTHVGAFMARTRLDEIPQLWNVVRGQMSLVGPRPEDPQFVALHADSYRHILTVRPGITGWSQLAFAGESRILDQSDPVGHYVDAILPAKVGLDCKYAERTRLGRDLVTMLWTAVAMLSRIQVAVHRESGRLGRRRRPATRVERAVARAVLAVEPVEL